MMPLEGAAISELSDLPHVQRTEEKKFHRKATKDTKKRSGAA